MNASSKGDGPGGSDLDDGVDTSDAMTDQVVAFVHQNRLRAVFSWKLILIFGIWSLAVAVVIWAGWLLLRGISPEEFRAIFGA